VIKISHNPFSITSWFRFANDSVLNAKDQPIHEPNQMDYQYGCYPSINWIFGNYVLPVLVIIILVISAIVAIVKGVKAGLTRYRSVSTKTTNEEELEVVVLVKK
jgi:hypothetical protein